jgi:putative selenium metabolism protein SsnA
MIITNANVITWEKPNRIIEDQAIYIEGGRIKEIGAGDELVQRYPADERINAHSQYVMPGSICAHTHFYGAYSRGLNIPGAPAENFTEILEKLWWPLDKSLSREAVRFSALVCLLDAIQHGTTTLVDHHASPNAIPNSLDEIAAAVDSAGVRASLCYEVTDRNGAAGARAGIDENIRFINLIKSGSDSDGRLSAMFGLHASLTLSEETLDACREAAPEDIGFHIHVAEDPADEEDCLEKYHTWVVDRLSHHDLLGSKSLVVHAVHIDELETQILKDTNTWVTHQPRSNMNNAVGLPKVEAMLESGINVCLGNDGFSNGMWDEWKACYLAHKLVNHDPRRMPASTIAQMAIYNNAGLAKMLFPKISLGAITPGAEADLIFVDYQPFTPVTADNLPWHIVFGFQDSMVTGTMVAGKLLMKDRQVLSLDEEKINYAARQLAPGVWKKFNKSFHKRSRRDTDDGG